MMSFESVTRMEKYALLGVRNLGTGDRREYSLKPRATGKKKQLFWIFCLRIYSNITAAGEEANASKKAECGGKSTRQGVRRGIE
jgi:hypothetical protein